MWSLVGLTMAKAANKNYLSLFNAHPTIKIAVYRVSVFQENSSNASGNMARGYRTFRFEAVHSGGIVAVPRRLNSALPALDAAITCRKDGVVTPSSELEPLGCGMLAEQGDKNAGSSCNDLFDFRCFMLPMVVNSDFRWDLRPIVLNPNQGLVVRQDGFAGTGLLSTSMFFSVVR